MITNELDNDKNFENISHYLTSTESIITRVSQLDAYNDYPFFYQYKTDYLPNPLGYRPDLIANGVALSKKEAWIKAVMETIERWYLGVYDEKSFIYASYTTMQKHHKRVQNPDSFLLISQKQLQEKKYKKFKGKNESKFYWVKADTLFSKDTTFLPAQLMYVLKPLYPEPLLRFPDSNGAASAFSIEQALYNAICELIERDAFAITYYNHLERAKIDTNTSFNPKIDKLIEEIHRNYFDIHLFDISLDINIPIFLCILVDKTNKGPKITIGLSCSISWEEAVYKALLEALQTLITTRDMMLIKNLVTQKNFNKIGQNVRVATNRVLYWADPNSVKDLDFLLSSPKQSFDKKNYLGFDISMSYKKRLEIVYKKLQAVGISHVFWQKTTPEKLEKWNIYGVKVVIPGMQSLCFMDDYLYFGGERLYTVPALCGLRKSAPAETDLNTIPHPLP